MRALLILVLTVGCIRLPGDPTPKPGQAEAAYIIWHDIYGRTDAPPTVYWMEGADLDCEEDGFRGFTVPIAGCSFGLTLSGSTVAVAWNPGYVNLHTSQMDHEFMHALKMREGGWGDFLHTAPDWQPGGRVERAEAAMTAAGY